MSADEANVLGERAYAFLRNAKRLLDEGEYDLAAFNVEQFCQPHKLLVKTGTYPVELKAEIRRRLGYDVPVELHIVSEEEYQSWYKRFVGKFEEI